MSRPELRFVGVELYFENLPAAAKFYMDTLGLKVTSYQPDHHAQLAGVSAFICLEKKGAESYPSLDKAVLFFEVADLKAMLASLQPGQIVHAEAAWAVLHDPEGHNILLLQSKQ